MKIVTCVAPVNIAVIKYWGKRDEELILPLNDSISGTLSVNNMCAKTTIAASSSFKENKFWLNGAEQPFDNKRLNNCLKEVKRRANSQLGDILQWNIHICSENNFPTAAGLASSAAGYACLVATLCALYGVEGDISSIARRGSGSACRSVLGGWVRWHRGESNNGLDSIATQIVPSTHWPEMRVLILVVNDKTKKYSSTLGMKRGVETSDLLKYRAEKIVPKRVPEMIKAINEKDFQTFAQITMQDSNQFHATCLDTYPPCRYINDTSHAIIELVHAYNQYKGCNKVAYTFDAGPNACLFLLQPDVEEVLGLVNYVFPSPSVSSVEYLKGDPVTAKILTENIKNSLSLSPHEPGELKYIIHTRIGDGPKILNDASSHLLADTGLPKS